MLRSDDLKWMTLGLLVWSVSAQGQPLVTRPEELAGPWEVAGPSSADGIFVMTSGSMGTAKTIQVRVYHRKTRGEYGGWYSLWPMPNTAGASFDGTNLRLLGLTATFDPNAAHWTGEWVIDDQTRKVVLERPRPAKGSTPNPVCGDWEKVPDTTQPPYPATSIRIHILQLPDGGFTAWMDTVRTIIPQRVQEESFGRSMKVVSADPTNVVLQNESPIATQRYQFSGALSEDGNTLAGTWNGRAPENFRRIR